MNYFKISCAFFALIGTALCAAEPEQKIYKIKYASTTYDLSLPYKTISKEVGKRFTVVPQGMLSIMKKESPRDYLATFFCSPCIAIVIKHKSTPCDYPIIMAHQDIQISPEILVQAIKISGIKEDDLHFTFYSDQNMTWDEKTVKTDDGIKSWADLHNASSHQEAMNAVASYYVALFPKASVQKILNPFKHPSFELKHHAFIDTTIAVGKDGSIFTFSPIAADIIGLTVEPACKTVEMTLANTRFREKFKINDMMSTEESLTIAHQALFSTCFNNLHRERAKKLTFNGEKVPFLFADITKART